MTIEGELTVRVEWDGRRVRKVTMRSTRPFAAARVLSGRTPADAVATVPLLFSVCGRAQEAAAAGALDAAQGRAAAPDVVAARERAVLQETIREYLRRILVDWPEAMGRAPVVAPVAAAHRRIAAAGDDRHGRNRLARELSEIAAEHVYGAAPDAWLALMDGDAIDAWAGGRHTLPATLLSGLLDSLPGLGRSEVALMPAPRRETLEAAVLPAMRADPDFALAPAWDGVPVETGALARMHAHPLVASLRARCGNSVATRMAARLVELAALIGEIPGAHADDAADPAIRAFMLGPGEGLAAVQTARGLLLHRARVAAGRVTACQIVAPTEWNFHAEGPLARGLAGMAADDEATLVRGARLAVQALDPCVACKVEVARA